MRTVLKNGINRRPCLCLQWHRPSNGTALANTSPRRRHNPEDDIARLEVGDEQRGEDPCVNQLCEMVADLLGKESWFKPEHLTDLDFAGTNFVPLVKGVVNKRESSN